MKRILLITLVLLLFVGCTAIFAQSARSAAGANAAPTETSDLGRTIDFTVKATGLDGKPLYAGDPKTSPPLSLSDIAVNALEQIVDDDQRPDRQATTGEMKFKRDELARKIYNKSSVKLTAEEISLLKERIGKVYGPLVVGFAWRALDSK